MTPGELAVIHAAAFQTTRAWSTSEFAALLSQHGAFVQEQDKCFALFRVIGDEAELLTLATAPENRRRGLAHSVLRDGHKTADKNGAKSVFLEVAEDNDAAKALYVSAGYTVVGQRPKYYDRDDGAAVGALVMRCDLNPA